MRIVQMRVFTVVFACFAVLTSATHAHAATFTIGGTVSGLSTGASVTLLNNGADSLTVTANGKFTFKTALATGATYNVSVGTPPANENCTVTAGSGTVGTVNVTTVKVVCKIKTYTIGGTMSGLITGRNITLLDNGGSALKLTKNGVFAFKTALASGATYNVTISIQAGGETCAVAGGTGTVGTANVTSVLVTCTPKNYTIGGTLSGLTTGTSVTLLDNGGDALKLSANGSFTFATSVASGAAYKVTVSVQAVGETCTVTGGAGTVGTANVTTVVVKCTPKLFTIGGSVAGLTTGASVTLLDNGADSLTVAANGKFTFVTKVASGSTYSVTVGTQPTGETCTVTAGSGTVGAANVTTVKVACASSSTFSIGGAVSGLNTGMSVTLLNNGGNALTVTANGAFTFTTKLASGAVYKVTVGTQPTGETCTVTNGTGTVGSANVTNVTVACAAASTFSIGGTVSGLNSGASLTLLNNGGNSLTVTANGAFTFTTKLASGATYSVTVGTQPTGESCTVANGSGTVGSANVTNVAVSCSAISSSGAYWIPYSASPIPNVTPVGSNGLFLIPSDKLSSSPAPTFVTTDTTQLLGIGTQVTVTGGVASYSPQVMMYADTASTGITKIFGLTLAGTSTVPTPVQISNLAVPSGQQICSAPGTSETDVSTPTTLFAVIEVGTAAQCAAATGTFEVVHYTDSSTTSPVVVSIKTTNINSIFQNGKLIGLLLFNSATSSLNLYASNAFTSPTQKITGLTGATYVAGVLSVATLSTSGLFYGVTTTGAVNELYRIDGSTQAATLIQNLGTGNLGNPAQDDTDLYYFVYTTTGTNTVATLNQVALTGGTPRLLYTSQAYVMSSATGISNYQLVGSNDSVVAFYFYSEPSTNGIQDPTKATATIYSVPVGATTTTPTTLKNYTAGNVLPYVFLAAPSGSGYAGNALFATVQHSTGTFPLFTIAFNAQSVPLNGTAAPAPITNSVYAPLGIISSALTDSVWQVTGITDTNGGYGGGTANAVNVGTLADTPFTTTGGGHYVFATGYTAALAAISSNNTAIGFLNNSAAVIQGTATLQEDGAAADLSSDFLLQINLTNTFVVPY